MGLRPPEKVRKLQAALHAKAKGWPSYRFYCLYDKLYREDVLAYAHQRSKANGGEVGVDGQSFKDIESYGRQKWLGELAESLRRKRYRPQAVRRVWIPKPDGKKRPLGIPTIRDRVVQMAAVLVLGPIFEADLEPEQYAYRTGRNALDALQAVHRLLRQGHREVVDADLSGYFDSIPHVELLKSVARRVSDRQVLHLVKLWLVAAVEEKDERGRKQRTTPNKDTGRGTPQGAPISPLLANLYMRRFIKGWKTLGHQRALDAHIVNYADDFVICCRGTAEEAARRMRRIMERVKLTVNSDKTRVCRVPEESFDFLSYTFGHCYRVRTGEAYVGSRPSQKAVRAVCRSISEATRARWGLKSAEDRVDRLNRMLRGWANYFRLGTVRKAYRAIDRHAAKRLRQWLTRKHRQSGHGTRRYPHEYLHGPLGLLELVPLASRRPWAKA